jgi:hypothetical protein
VSRPVEYVVRYRLVLPRTGIAWFCAPFQWHERSWRVTPEHGLFLAREAAESEFTAKRDRDGRYYELKLVEVRADGETVLEAWASEESEP